MRQKEQRLWDSFKRQLPATLWAQRIENVVTDGMPDTYIVTETGRSVWVELKSPKPKARPSTALLSSEGLNVAQIGWMMKATVRNLPAYVLIRDDAKNLYLVPSRFATGLNRLTPAEVRSASVAESWRAVMKCIEEGHNED